MPSFDVVCRVDLQEVDNEIQQTLREIAQRFDFKNQPTEVRREDTAKQKIDLQRGIATDKAREIVKLVKDTKLKVQVAVQGDQLRVTGKKKDELQAIVKLLREHDLGIAMQFANFRD